MDRQSLLNTIRTIRIQKGFSQEALAQDMGVSVAAYSKIERGETNVSLDRVLQILDYLQISFYELLYMNDLFEKGVEAMFVEDAPITTHYGIQSLSEELRKLKDENQRLKTLLDLQKGISELEKAKALGKDIQNGLDL